MNIDERFKQFIGRGPLMSTRRCIVEKLVRYNPQLEAEKIDEILEEIELMCKGCASERHWKSL